MLYRLAPAVSSLSLTSVAFLSLAACGDGDNAAMDALSGMMGKANTPQEAIVGSWFPIHNHKSDRLQFLDDGTLLSEANIIGKVSVVGEDMMKIGPDVPEGSEQAGTSGGTMLQFTQEGDYFRVCPPGTDEKCSEYFRHTESHVDSIWSQRIPKKGKAQILGVWADAESPQRTFIFVENADGTLKAASEHYRTNFRVRRVSPEHWVLRTRDACNSYSACNWRTAELRRTESESGEIVLAGRMGGRGSHEAFQLRRVGDVPAQIPQLPDGPSAPNFSGIPSIRF